MPHPAPQLHDLPIPPEKGQPLCIKSTASPFLYKMRSPMPYPRTILASLTLLILTALPAQAQLDPQTGLTRLRGLISSTPANHRCFILTDRSGAQITVNLDSKTQFIFGRDPGSPVDVLQVGDQVSAHINANNVAVDVTNRNFGNRPSAAELKQLLDLSDDDCQVIVPLIAQVTSLQQAVDGQTRGTDVRTARDALRFLLQNPSTANSDIASRLAVLRSARATAQRQLTKAREDLTSLLTLRQEAILLQQGILQ